MRGIRCALFIFILSNLAVILGWYYKQLHPVGMSVLVFTELIAFKAKELKILYYIPTIIFEPLALVCFLNNSELSFGFGITFACLWVVLQMGVCIKMKIDTQDIAVVREDIGNLRRIRIIENEERPTLAVSFIIDHVIQKEEITDNFAVSANTETCSICLDDLNKYIILPCSHRLHKRCLLEMLNRNMLSCPLCKREIVL